MIPMDPTWAAASYAELHIASNSDNDAVKSIEKHLTNIGIAVYGNTIARSLENVINFIAQVIYYGSNSIFRVPTVGEEQFKLVTVGKGLLRGSSAILPYKFLSRVASGFLTRERFMRNCFGMSLNSQQLLNRFQKCLFIWGFLSVIDFMFDVAQVHTCPSLANYPLKGLVKLLILLNFTFGFVKYLLAKYNQVRVSKKNQYHPHCSKIFNCPLCWEKPVNYAALLCGHVFCWACALKSIKEREECPLCKGRNPFPRVIPLINL